MTDSRHTQVQTWIAGAGLIFLILAFFGIGHFTDFFGKAPAPSTPTPHPTAKASPAVAIPPPAPVTSGERPEIGAKGVRASVSLTPNGGTQTLDATVTVKLHNGSKFPVRLAWLAAADNASFDLGIGRLATPRAATRFAGLPNCTYASADQCRPTGGADLAPGETVDATMTLQADIPAADADRALKAKRGIFTARLSVYPPAPAGGVEKTISVDVGVDR